MRELLSYRAHDLDIDGFGQPRQLFQGIGCRPGLILTLDGDQESLFSWAVGGMGRAWNGNLLEITSDSGEFLIIPWSDTAVAVFRGRDPATALPGNRVEDLAGADLQILLRQGDAAALLLQPTLVCL
jgi:hypothetical protein